MEELLNKITCDDCLKVFPKISDNSVHLAITSPPYNLSLNYDTYKDDKAYEQYLDWLKQVWIETERVLVPGGRFALNIAPTSIKNFKPIHHDFANQLREIGMIMRTEILWYKQTMRRRTAWGSWGSPANPHIVPSWEYILVFSKEKWNLPGDPAGVDITEEEFMRFSDGFWYIPPVSQRRDHPSPFPEELVYRLIKFYTYKGNLILDMFGGTGTVAVIAYKTGRNFIHIDISPQYCEIALRRLKEAEQQAELNLRVGAVGKKISIEELRHGAHYKKRIEHKKSESQTRLLEEQERYSK